MDIDRKGSTVLVLGQGTTEVYIDPANSTCIGLAVVLHPQPLLGGNALHKVPDFIARGLAAQGWTVLRPNFRGVGQSSGVHDHGKGETDDILDLVSTVRESGHAQPLALIGFSFGAYVAACVSHKLHQRGEAASHTSLLGMPFGKVSGGRIYDTPADLPNCLVVHGEKDERVPLASVMEWARPSNHPGTVIPNADHFFSGSLPVMRNLVLKHLQRSESYMLD